LVVVLWYTRRLNLFNVNGANFFLDLSRTFLVCRNWLLPWRVQLLLRALNLSRTPFRNLEFLFVKVKSVVHILVRIFFVANSRVMFLKVTFVATILLWDFLHLFLRLNLLATAFSHFLIIFLLRTLLSCLSVTIKDPCNQSDWLLVF
jgi:hypothetical protein